MVFEMRPIGYVVGGRPSPEDDFWGGTQTRIRLRDGVPSEALDGIEEFSHAEILFVFDRVDATDANETWSRHPRNNPGLPLAGIFSQRGRTRPNRIGCTIVRVLGRQGRMLHVGELDAIDGTPVLDIKPVLCEFLPREPVRQPQWATDVMADYWRQADDAEVTIRIADTGDAQLLAELGERTFRETFGAANTPQDMAAYTSCSFGLHTQAMELADEASTFLIAEVAGIAVGYARIRSGLAPACVAGIRPVEIVRFYVDGPWIGTDVSGVLMAACLAETRKRSSDVVWLDVWEHNPRAIAFYEKWGFSIVGTQDFLLGNDVQHDLLMARDAG
jgi:tRNA (Thr-GGU) A37 N-methylase/ribosomal protein S18 acetylase RimI-like enzyme